MPADAPLSIILLLVSVGALLWGLRLLRRSRQRVGDTPHCGRCDYDLTANASAVCPECGLALDVPGTVVRGEVVYRRGAWARGVLMFVLGSVLGGAVGVHFARTYDWYRLRPASWLIDDLAAGPPRDVRRAWGELARRVAAGTLGDAAHARLTGVAIAQLQRTPAPPAKPTLVLRELSEYLGQRALDGKLTPGELDGAFGAGVSPALRVRRLIRAGDPTPVELSINWRGPTAGGLWIGAAESTVTVGGGGEVNRQGGLAFSGFGGGGSTTHYLKGRPAGDYPVVVTQTFRAYRGEMNLNDPDPTRLIHQWTVTATGLLHVVADEPPDSPDAFRLIDKPELLPAMRAAVTIQRFAVEDGGPGARRRLQLRVALRNPPENVAFDVTALVAGREFDLGAVRVARGQSTTWYLGADPLRDLTFEKADFRFRASPKAARNTIDLYGIWNGELLIKDVPLTREAPATRPAP